MYAWIWHKLPGAVWSKLTLSLVLFAAVGSLLWYVVFPWATPLLPFDDVQVGTGTEQGTAPDQPGGGTDPDDGPDDIPYSTESNAPHPSDTPGN